MVTDFMGKSTIGFIACLNLYISLFSMENVSCCFDLLPSETKKLIFSDAMISDPYNAWQFACVCKNWNHEVNDLHLTTNIASINPGMYAYSYVVKPNPRSCLQTKGLAEYVRINNWFANIMEYPDITEAYLEEEFCSKERPYQYIVCNKNDYFPLQSTCREAHSVGAQFLLSHGVMPSQKHFDLTLRIIKRQSNYTNAQPHVHMFKMLCDSNPVIARSHKLFFDVLYKFSKKITRYYHLLQALVEVGTDLNYRDEDDDTVLSFLYCLHEAEKARIKKEGYRKIAAWCIQNGADPYIKPKNDECVYELAKQNEDQSFFELIKVHYKLVAIKD